MTQPTTSEEAQQLSKGTQIRSGRAVHFALPSRFLVLRRALCFIRFVSRVKSGRRSVPSCRLAAAEIDRRYLGEAPGAVPNIFGSFRISFCSSPLFNPRNASANDS